MKVVVLTLLASFTFFLTAVTEQQRIGGSRERERLFVSPPASRGTVDALSPTVNHEDDSLRIPQSEFRIFVGQPQQPTCVEEKKVQQRIVGHLKLQFRQLQNMELKVAEWGLSEIKGLFKVTISLKRPQDMTEQKLSAYVTSDCSFVLVNPLVLNLAVDPEELQRKRLQEEQKRVEEERARIQEALSKIVLAGVPMKGRPEAPVTILEFSDYQCPFCARAAKVVEGVMKTYEGKVKLYIKQFPLSTIHPWARLASIASLCVYDQSPEAFWKFHDMMFASQGAITPSNVNEKVKGFAKTLQLDVAKFETCLTDSTVAERVDKDLQEGEALGVTGTPTFIINGQKLVGAQPEEALRNIIEAALKK